MFIWKPEVYPGPQMPDSCRRRCRKSPVDAEPQLSSLDGLGGGLLHSASSGDSQVPCEEMESQLHPVHLQATTPAWNPAIFLISQAHLHLEPSGWLSLENRQDRKDALTQPLPTERSPPLQFRLNTGHYLTVMPSWQRSQENSN